MITAHAQSVLSNEDVLLALSCHVRGDWGELGVEDKATNDRALVIGERLLSSYRTVDGMKFWIITEWDRSATTVLLPEDY
jgi:hypothetical protein